MNFFKIWLTENLVNHSKFFDIRNMISMTPYYRRNKMNQFDKFEFTREQADFGCIRVSAFVLFSYWFSLFKTLSLFNPNSRLIKRQIFVISYSKKKNVTKTIMSINVINKRSNRGLKSALFTNYFVVNNIHHHFLKLEYTIINTDSLRWIRHLEWQLLIVRVPVLYLDEPRTT